MSMCISVKTFQRKTFDVRRLSQKPLIQKMHTEPEILNRGIEGYHAGSELPELIDSAKGMKKYQNTVFMHILVLYAFSGSEVFD